MIYNDKPFERTMKLILYEVIWRTFESKKLLGKYSILFFE